MSCVMRLREREGLDENSWSKTEQKQNEKEMDQDKLGKSEKGKIGMVK